MNTILQTILETYYMGLEATADIIKNIIKELEASNKVILNM